MEWLGLKGRGLTGDLDSLLQRQILLLHRIYTNPSCAGHPPSWTPLCNHGSHRSLYRGFGFFTAAADTAAASEIYKPFLRWTPSQLDTLMQSWVRPIIMPEQYVRPISQTNMSDQYVRPISQTNKSDHKVRPISQNNMSDQ